MKDQFEGRVRQRMKTHGRYRTRGELTEDMAKLLRREHTAIVRAVRHIRQEVLQSPDPDAPHNRYYLLALEDVLALLAKRKGRKA